MWSTAPRSPIGKTDEDGITVSKLAALVLIEDCQDDPENQENQTHGGIPSVTGEHLADVVENQLEGQSLGHHSRLEPAGRMGKKLKLQQEQAVIPGRKSWTCGKDRDFGRERAARPAASTSGAEPDMTAKRAMNGGASNCLWPPFTWLLIGIVGKYPLMATRGNA